MTFFRKIRRRPDAPRSDVHARRVLESGLFDAEWYRAAYPEIAAFGPGPLAHFCEYGLHEHRDPGPNFDTRRYLRACPEAGAGPVPPFLRALADGEPAQGRPPWLSDAPETLLYLLRTSGLFDAAWYRDAYPDVARSGEDALGHYLDHGAAELRDPGPAFDAEHYAAAYPEYRAACASPIAHYLRLGRRRGYRPTGLSRYGRWLAAHDDLTPRDRARIAAEPVPGTVHAVLVADGRSLAGIAALLAALDDQAGASWRARLLRGPDLDTPAWAAIAARVAGAARIACVAARADALAGLADGDVVVLGAGGARLRPHALHAFAAALVHAQAEAAYCDHDRIDGDGVRHAPVFKPAMSPCLMRHLPYAGPVIALRIGPRTRAALALALTRLDDPERAWADLLLGLDTARVIRLPLVLYHLPVEAPVPPARTNQPVPGPHPSGPPADAPAAPAPSVRIVIPTRDRSAVLKACIDSILAATDYPPDRYGVVIVDNASVEEETARYLAEAVSDPRVAVVPSPGAFNFSKICNDGAAGADAEILVFLNNDMTVRAAGWLRTLAAHARRPEVGAVGAQLLYPDETVQHGGIVLGVDGVGAHALVALPADAARALDATRELSAVTGACLAIRRSVFEALGGFDPLLRIDFNDVDLCCAALAAGYRNLYVAQALFHHHESLSRGTPASRAGRHRNQREAIRVRQRHAALILDDPSYSPNLSLERIGALAVPPRPVPPWRRPAGGVRRVLLLGGGGEPGCGIARRVAEQAAGLAGRGFEVIVGAPEREPAGGAHPHVALADARAAAIFATREGVDALVVHAPPFFAVTRHLGRRPLVYLVDHGEPAPWLFPDREAREDAALDRRVCASLARRVFATSATARDALFGQDAILLADGRVPAAWSEAWAARRPALRERLGFADRFVVLHLCRMGAAERAHNGFDAYAALAGEHLFTDPALAGCALFVAADRGTIAYPADVAPADLLLRGDLGEADLTDLFAASDLYLTTQRWQGPDCGIAQALAMGLPVVASAIAAHCAHPIETAPDVPGLCALVSRHAELRRSGPVPRRAVLAPAADPQALLADTIALDLERDSAAHWI